MNFKWLFLKELFWLIIYFVEWNLFFLLLRFTINFSKKMNCDDNEGFSIDLRGVQKWNGRLNKWHAYKTCFSSTSICLLILCALEIKTNAKKQNQGFVALLASSSIVLEKRYILSLCNYLNRGYCSSSSQKRLKDINFQLSAYSICSINRSLSMNTIILLRIGKPEHATSFEKYLEYSMAANS